MNVDVIQLKVNIQLIGTKKKLPSFNWWIKGERERQRQRRKEREENKFLRRKKDDDDDK